MVQDDGLLVSLFTQKLKLTFPNPSKSKEEVESGMRQNLVKEKELLEQIEAAKAAEADEAADAKGKGKKGAAKSSAELVDELNALLALDKSGWALVDFPRTLSQARALEKMFTGYQAKSDAAKPAATE